MDWENEELIAVGVDQVQGLIGSSLPSHEEDTDRLSIHIYIKIYIYTFTHI